MIYYNRYKEFLVNGYLKNVPGIILPPKSTDRYVTYKEGKSRTDKISQQFYDTPYFGWLILLANPGYGENEWSIPDGSILRIPFPLRSSLESYKSALEKHFLYYGKG